MRRPRPSLRARATISVGLTALAVATVLAVTAYALASRYFLDQRVESAETQAYVHARLARTVLRQEQPDLPALLDALGGGGASSILIRHRNEWFSSEVGVAADAVPDELLVHLEDGGAGYLRARSGDGELDLLVGVAVPAVDALYVEVFPLDELESTLALLREALGFGVLGGALAGALAGYASARRVVRPLAPVAAAAEQIAAGDLGTRLRHEDDPDLRRLVDAFNDMAVALEQRIDREARFAADVTHELRSPLAAVAAALEVIMRRRHDLPPTVVDALDVLDEKVQGFQQTVLELLEIARLDAGTAELQLDLVDLEHLLPRVAEVHGKGEVAVTFEPDAPRMVTVDRRRLAQVCENLTANATRYAGGLVAITVARVDGDAFELRFDDAGPGISPDERDVVFERFHRGRSGAEAGPGSGTGLGLSLVAEHVALHGGRVWVEEAPTGGARFVVHLPDREFEGP